MELATFSSDTGAYKSIDNRDSQFKPKGNNPSQSEVGSQQVDNKNNRLKNRLKNVGFDDVFTIIKAKDYIATNKKKVIALSNNLPGKQEMINQESEAIIQRQDGSEFVDNKVNH